MDVCEPGRALNREIAEAERLVVPRRIADKPRRIAILRGETRRSRSTLNTSDTRHKGTGPPCHV